MENRGSFCRRASFFLTLGANGNAEAAGMFAAVLAAFKNIEANLAPFVGMELRPREGLHRTGIDTDVAFAAGLVEGRTHVQGGVGQDRDETGPRTEGLG